MVQWYLGCSQWRLFEPFVFRSTGFSFENLFCLRLEFTAHKFDHLDKLDGEMRTLATRLWQSGFSCLLSAAEKQVPKPKLLIKVLCALRAAFKHERPIPDRMLKDLAAVGVMAAGPCAEEWNTALAHRAAELAEIERVWFEESRTLRKALWRLTADPAFQEAIFLSSPDASAGLSRCTIEGAEDIPDNSKNRALERLAFGYLQRLCAKNDTTSFFGPVQYGTFCPRASNSLHFAARRATRWSRRKVFFAHWAVTALAAELVKDDVVFQHTRPLRSPLVSVQDLDAGRFMHHGADKAFELPQPGARLLQAAEGQHTVAELAALQAVPLPSALQTFRRMAQMRLVDCSLRVPSTTVDALAALAETITALPPDCALRAQSMISQAQQLRHDFQSAPWPRRRQHFLAAEAWLQAMGLQSRRNGGELYGDRLALYEDCAGPLEQLRVGGALYQRIERALPPLMEFLAGAAILRRLDAQDRIREHLAAGGSRLYIDLVRSMPTTTPPGSREQALNVRLRAMLESAGSEHGIELTPSMLSAALEPWHDTIERELAGFALMLPSPDLMVAARSKAHLEAGDFQLVLSELHDDCSTLFAGFFAEFHSDPGDLRRQLESHIRGQPGWQGLATILGNRRSKHVTPELPGMTIHLSGVSHKHDEQIVPVSEVVIEETGQGLYLSARGRRLLLYPGDLHSLVHLAFALPCVVPLDWASIRDQAHTPRIAMDSLVIQRAAWKVETASMPPVRPGRTELTGLRQLRTWLRAQGLPDWTFARWSRDEKPILVDLNNPWSLDMLQRVAMRNSTLQFTEMYPDPSHLFFDDGQGLQTFEMRLALSRAVGPLARPPAAAGPERASCRPVDATPMNPARARH